MDLNNKEQILKAIGSAIESYEKKNMLADALFWSSIRGAIHQDLEDKEDED